MNIAQQISITLPNIPGSFARVCDALRAAKVNIDAVCCTERPESSTIHMIVDDIEEAEPHLKQLGNVIVEDVLAFDMKNEPGAIFSIVRTLAGASVNIRNLYATTHGKGEAMVYVVVDDVEKAKAAVSC